MHYYYQLTFDSVPGTKYLIGANTTLIIARRVKSAINLKLPN